MTKTIAGNGRSRAKAFVVMGVLLVGLLGVEPAASGASTAGPRPVGEAVTGPMTHRRLTSVMVPNLCGLRRARLHNGVHPLSRVYPDDGPAAWIIGYGEYDSGPKATRIGEINHRGARDGLIVMRCVFSTHSSYVYDHVLAYRSNGTLMGRLPISRNIPPSWAQFGVVLGSTFIRDQVVHVRVLHYRPSDAHCCPSLATSLRFRWAGDRFVRV